ncbi:MAG TPA: N-acetylmuramoyl-L-alanine amidase [Verrucomicrobiales bacterium]|jgi:N-acetylmuramoyl-L-alanine amidase|nr:N-acetylmuramoyl-L-alanine amidase [Akkermansiaceae bacterium]HCC20861.1 N-acetylmuramoyl-L-alanine amidase [Verrucomicrobiales bacterium]HCI92578.1 N-acetylmuramoyl-L-alanine amidase [Verrucomicrobiales bacterium]HCL96642.1 N-acetylmuramoyl-L-alanine amidase [Verrucomicrobiales bacterium]
MISRKTHRFLLACITLIVLLVGTTQAKSFRYVVIDPGHGGHDKGGNSGKVYEKHLALDTALRLEYILKQRGISTKMTRRSDVFISLPRRVAIGKRYSRSIFVSIHFNHAWRREASGLETFYHGSEGKKLANHVQRGITSKLSTPNRGAKYARFYVIRNSKYPAILVEGGFVSNRKERERMKKAWFRQSLAEGIAEGILKYKQSW